MEIDGFDWDAGNLTKSLRKHDVTTQEIEEIFANQPLYIYPDPKHSQHEKRQLAFGRTGVGRQLVVVFTMRHKDQQLLIRPISARSMHRKERVIYEKAATQI